MLKLMGSKGVIALIATITILCGGAFLLFSDSGVRAADDAKNQLDVDHSSSGSITGGIFSMSDLMKKTASQRCTFSSKSETADSSGVVYVSEGMMRGDFESVVKVGTPGKVTTSHMISDKEFTYVWGDEMPTMGMKMSKTMMEEQKSKAGVKTGPSPLEMDNQVDFVCAPWSADATMLTPPASVTFNDMDGMMQGKSMPGVPVSAGTAGANYGATNLAPGGGTDIKAAQCSACVQTGENQGACRAALGCK